ncbi:hypothetical protein BRD09_01370 [Halobacteriales archaeon SW_10_68_16]|nr:MAG: hypothetical protein BRD09_01370 [Halobacteriales archaeon SW_10_68_16]
MRRRELLVGTGSVVIGALAGCLGDSDTGDTPDESTPTDTPDSASTPTPERVGDRRVVTVSGTGEVRGDPDRALLEFEIQARADSASAVRDDLGTRADAGRAALLETGLSEDDITTSRFRISERIDHRRLREADVDPDSPEARERFRYYEGTHSLKVDLDDVDAVGSVIDTAVDAGADEVDRVTFTLSEEKRTDLREEALRRRGDGRRRLQRPGRSGRALGRHRAPGDADARRRRWRWIDGGRTRRRDRLCRR